MFNSKLKKNAISIFEESVNRYMQTTETTQILSLELMLERQKSLQVIESVERYVNSLANTDKIFDKDFGQLNVFVSNFKDASEFKAESINADKFKAESINVAILGGSIAGAGAAVGIGVATFGTTAVIAIATTFGKASTGTSISALSGAAANNAALAWLGGGARVAGGGGMSAGKALLGLAGPIGWTIGGCAIFGGASFAILKNKKIADKANSEKVKIEEIICKFTRFNSEIVEMKSLTILNTEDLRQCSDDIVALNKQDYLEYTFDEKLALGTLVNNTLSLGKLLDRTVKTY